MELPLQSACQKKKEKRISQKNKRGKNRERKTRFGKCQLCGGIRPKKPKTETAIQQCKTVFISLAVTDSVNNVGGRAFVRGFSEGFSHTESTAWVRGDCFPPYVEVVTKFPVSGNSMVAFVNQWRGRASLSIGLIFPEDRYLKTIYQIT